MAKLDSLPQEDLLVLYRMINRAGLNGKDALAYIETNGALPPELLAKGGFSQSEIDSVNKNILSKITGNYQGNVLGQNVETAQQTVDRMTINVDQRTKDTVNQIIQNLNNNGSLDPSQINYLKQAGLTDGAIQQIKAGLNPQDTVNKKQDQLVSGDITKFTDDELKQRLKDLQELSSVKNATISPDIANKITSVQDLLNTRTKTTQGQNEMTSLLSNLPGQLQANTDQYIQGETASAQRTLEQNLLPEVLQGLNVRGLLQSGDVESELARTASGVYGDVQNEYAAQMQADDQFFQQAAYQNELQKSLTAGQDITAQTAADRQDAMTQQQQRFSAGQSSLNQNLQQKLFQKQQERLLTSQQEQLKREQAAQDRAFQNQLISGLTGAAVSLGGSAIIGGLSSSKSGGGTSTKTG